MASPRLPHLFLSTPPQVSTYTTAKMNPVQAKPNAPRQRNSHGNYLRSQFDMAWEDSTDELAVAHSARTGIYVEFVGAAGFELVYQSLENLTKNIRLMNVREYKAPGTQTITQFATVFIPLAHRNFFLSRINAYINEDASPGKPKHEKLIASISGIRKAVLSSFWSDRTPLQSKDNEQRWVEVWLNTDEPDQITLFDQLLTLNQIEKRDDYLKFVDRTVVVVQASSIQLQTLIGASDLIAEFRSARTTASYWTDMNNRDQAHWVSHLLSRCNFSGNSNTSICILDSGINHGHPLLSPLVNDQDALTYHPDWGVHDHDNFGHGTLMAGVCGYGDLRSALDGDHRITVPYKLESVKIIPPPPNSNNERNWGSITQQSVSLAEIQAPHRHRIICMAVAAPDTNDRGSPSSWSAAVDQLAFGDAHFDKKRLVILCAGNSYHIEDAARQYPDYQVSDSIHDPGQSWNALTIGSYTELDEISNPNLTHYSAVAPKGGLSPFTTTSSTWEDNKWPIKPELVLEGGNLGVDENDPGRFVTRCDDLSLISTSKEPHLQNFTNFEMTSASAGIAAWMAANIQASSPLYWPETVRGLMVHSASWPKKLKEQFAGNENKTSYKHLLSVCGYGVPDLEKAISSTQNALTLISQHTIQPFDKTEDGSAYRTRDLHLHELPWPKEELLKFPDGVAVEMRVTLSYFIEPSPGEIGWKDRYRYASHALRFGLNSPGESQDEFQRRINKDARSHKDDKPGTSSPASHWVIGDARNRGSIHSDIWKGTAAELADSNMIAVYPAIGWWRERPGKNRWDTKTRYSLIVSISTPDESIDIYTPVLTQIKIANKVATEISI